MTTDTIQSAATLTCGHEFTQATVESGTYPDGVFSPSPSLCATCKRRQCDDCAANDVICSCCTGGICGPCALLKTRFRNAPNHPRLGGQHAEYLCAPCAAKQDAARTLLDQRARFQLNYADLWLSDIAADLKAALAETEKAL
jgi:hypothetical protein